ncbi:hypothetical protein PWT90_06543 [Aphanocladium album]|nr:hypothetical protein PWT90_06543 [Aphanocladium album]
MPISIFQLPRELCMLILDQIPDHALFHLSATCRAYRTELAPRLFRTIRFRNDANSATSALLAAKKFGQLTEKLTFAHVAGGAKDCVPLLASPVLLSATRNLLRGLDLPKLQTIELMLETHESSHHQWKVQTLALLATTEHPAETADAEDKYEWRALLNEAYAAISMNTTISELIMDVFFPINVSALYSRGFRDLLGRLESATITLASPESYGGRLDTFQYHGYTGFLAKLSHVFFLHMRKLQKLKLRAAFAVPLGGVWPHSIVLSLPPESLPQLTLLKLENCFLSSELLEFIKAHKDTLRHVDMHNCAADFSGSRGDLEGPLPRETWAYFFLEIWTLQPPALIRFDVEYSYDILVELFWDWEPSEFADLNEKAAEQAAECMAHNLLADTNRNIFSYATLDMGFGNLIVHRYINRIQATESKDAIAISCYSGS